MGFSRWHANIAAGSGTPASYGWQPTDGISTPNDTMSGPSWGQGNCIKTGVMFLGTSAGNTGWDTKTGSSSIVDGSSTTILASESVLAGASGGNTFTSLQATNWACPHPNFIGFVASDRVWTNNAGNGLSTMTSSTMVANTDAPGWMWANVKNSGTSTTETYAPMESINFGLNVGEEGACPYPNSNHPAVSTSSSATARRGSSATRSTAPSTPS